MPSRKAPKEYNLLVLFPEIAAEWHPTKNGLLRPEDVIPGSNKFVYWLCPKGHELKAAVYTRTKNGCKTCHRLLLKKKNHWVNLLEGNPNLVKEWHPEKNYPLTPTDVPVNGRMKVWWFCAMGHSWQAIIGNRNIGKGCPYCSGKYASEEYNFAVLFPKKAKLWHPDKNGLLTPDSVTPGSENLVWWLCDKGHEWQEKVRHSRKLSGCPICKKLKKKEAV